MSPTEHDRALMEERALRLARPEADADATPPVEVLLFTRGGESWALDTRYVVEVMRLGTVTPLPGAEPDVVGVMAWRGEPLLVRELAAAAVEAHEQWLISLGEAHAAFGLAVDALPGLAALRAADIHPPTALARDRQWLRGVTDDAVLVIDGRELIRSRTGGDTS